ncbi:MAG: hypothetical protein KME42_17570 [Tildeniella nuda ZEHNDER 1965/U140]|jgi:hypothetical protein|nr:hypothetical protein [Tildeniella nuda ZEHNDER 1965/U140]
MLITVLVCNVSVGLLCLVAAWQLWRLKHRLARAANTLSSFERAVHRVLHRAPDTIARGHSGIDQLRAHYRSLEPQLQRAQQALALLSLGQTLWQRRFLLVQRSRSPSKASPSRSLR